MTDLVQIVIDAHGGLSAWQNYDQIAADLQQGGALWGLKGQAGVLDQTRVMASLHDERASHAPFGDAGRRSRFTPTAVAIENQDGQTLAMLERPRESFAGHVLETPWTALQLAYFAGCAMWTYLNIPFLLAWPGVSSEEIEPWREGEEIWRRLRFTLPSHIESHSPVQTLYVGHDGLLRRHDYDVEIAGGTPGAHYITAYEEVSGIQFPTRRRIYPRGPDGRPVSDLLVVSIDLSNIVLS